MEQNQSGEQKPSRPWCSLLALTGGLLLLVVLALLMVWIGTLLR